MDIAVTILLLLFVLPLSGALAKVTKVPLPILQIAIGLALAWPTGGVHLTLDPELFLLIFIAPLLFADAFNIPKREFRELLAPIISLAFGLVFFTVVMFGYALHWLVPELPLPVAFALGAVLSPTDAVAVSSIVDRSRVPPRLMHILEGEALLNDASGLVVFRFAVAAALTGQFSLAVITGSFVWAVIGGILAGLAIAFGAVKLLTLLNRRDGSTSESQVVVTLILPFFAYLLAEHLHASGILAAVATGFTIARMGYFRFLTVSARIQNGALWDTLPFIFNGVIFLLLGLQLPDIFSAIPPELSTGMPVVEPILIVLALTATLLALRFVWIIIAIAIRRSVSAWRGNPRPREGLRVRVVMTIAGVRGAVTLAGILSLPLSLPSGGPFPGREVAIFLAAGVILCSLILASALLPILTRDLVMAQGEPLETEERGARVAAAEAAIAKIEEMAQAAEADGKSIARDVAARLIEKYNLKIGSDNGKRDEEVAESAHDALQLERNMTVAALAAEREAMRKQLADRKINDETMHKLISELVLAEALVLRRLGGSGGST